MVVCWNAPVELLQHQSLRCVAVKTAVFRLMGHSAKGVSLPSFMKCCRSIGVVATDDELAALFAKFDTSGTFMGSDMMFAGDVGLRCRLEVSAGGVDWSVSGAAFLPISHLPRQ